MRFDHALKYLPLFPGLFAHHCLKALVTNCSPVYRVLCVLVTNIVSKDIHNKQQAMVDTPSSSLCTDLIRMFKTFDQMEVYPIHPVIKMNVKNVNRIHPVSSDNKRIPSSFHRKRKASLQWRLLYRGADLNCRPQGYESCALTN